MRVLGVDEIIAIALSCTFGSEHKTWAAEPTIQTRTIQFVGCSSVEVTEQPYWPITPLSYASHASSKRRIVKYCGSLRSKRQCQSKQFYGNRKVKDAIHRRLPGFGRFETTIV